MTQEIDNFRIDLKDLVVQFIERENAFDASALNEMVSCMGKLCSLTKDHPTPDFEMLLLMMVEAGRRVQGIQTDIPVPESFPDHRWRELYDASYLFFWRKTFRQATLHLVNLEIRKGKPVRFSEETLKEIVQTAYLKVHEKIIDIDKILPYFFKVLETKYLDRIKTDFRHKRKISAYFREMNPPKGEDVFKNEESESEEEKGSSIRKRKKKK